MSGHGSQTLLRTRPRPVSTTSLVVSLVILLAGMKLLNKGMTWTTVCWNDKKNHLRTYRVGGLDTVKRPRIRSDEARLLLATTS